MERRRAMGGWHEPSMQAGARAVRRDHETDRWLAMTGCAIRVLDGSRLPQSRIAHLALVAVDGRVHQWFCSALATMQRFSMKNVVGAVVQFTTLGTILSVLATVVHEWFFYWRLAPELVDLPMASDYLTTAARWLPTAAFTMLVGAAIGAIASQAEGRTLIARHDTGQTPWVRRLFGVLTHLTMFGIAATSSVYGFLLLLFDPDPPAGAVAVLLVVIWAVIFLPGVLKALTKRTAEGLLNLPAAAVLAITPVLFVYCASLGVNDARAIQDVEQGTHSITFRDKGSIKNVLIVRNLAAGVLIAIPHEGSIRYFPWNGVTSLTAEIGSSRKQSRLCEWLRTLSPDEDQNREWSLTGILQGMCQAFTGEQAQSIGRNSTTAPSVEH